MKDLTVDRMFEIAKANNYKIFKDPFELNLWGVRAGDQVVKEFNDELFIFYCNGLGTWFTKQFTITTDPSDLYLLKPIASKGTAIVKSGQYLNLWKFGFHKGKQDHPALIQVNPIKVYRDNNLDAQKNFNEASVEEGLFGINMHRASQWGITRLVGLYGAGCQVHEDGDRYKNTFIPIVKSSLSIKDRLFSYTLITEKML